MKKTALRMIALVLSAVVLFSCFAVPAGAAAPKYCDDLPIVYIKGASRVVYDEAGNEVYPIKGELSDAILEHSDELLVAFNKSMLSQNWDYYCDKLVEIVSAIYEPGTLDCNGEARNGTHAEANPAPKVKYSEYVMGDYIFNHDSRLDPCAVAADLHAYIQQVLAATGKKKVNLVSRCYGSNIAAAYLTIYGSDLIDTCVMYVPATKGALATSEGFAGKIKFDPDMLAYYTNFSDEDGNEMGELLASLVNVTYCISMLGAGTTMVQSIYDKIADNIVPRLVLSTFGTMPAYWSMVDDENYETAKNLIFAGKMQEYSGLINKIDYYHYNVMNRIDQTISTLTSRGMKFAIVAKYNVPLMPFFEDSDKQGDGSIELSAISFGGTAEKYGDTLSTDYVMQSKLLGTSKYISKDLIVDASSCSFRDWTWFVRDISHSNFHTSVNRIIYRILNASSQLTVWQDEEYPQYFSFDAQTGTISPVTSSQPSGSSENTNGVIGLLLRLISLILNFFRIFFK